jgi:hypothetical protein
MKLYAVYGPDGKPVHGVGRVTYIHPEEKTAWWLAGFLYPEKIEQAERAGYTCEPVEIVRKGERDGK